MSAALADMHRSRTAIVVFAHGEGPGERRLPEVMARATAAAVLRGRGDADVVVASDGLSDRIWPSTFSIVPQHGDGFEARFLGALRRVASDGYDRIVAVGIDTPGLTAEDIRRAVETDEQIVGPSRDGGFYLLGLAAGDVEQLAGLPWRTSRVLDALVARLNGVIRLPVRRDVDDERDAKRMFRVLDRLARLYCGRALLRRERVVVVDRVACRPTDEAALASHRSRAPPRA